MSLNEAQVSKIAKLARIKISEDEKLKFTKELNGIFSWIEQLQEVDTNGVEPLYSVNTDELTLREDVVNDGNKRDRVLKNSPVSKYGYFAVPKVIE